MKPMGVEEVRRAMQGRWKAAPRLPASGVEGVSIDSRTAKVGDLFVAIAGERFDGHAFVSQAADAGCAAAIVAADAEVAAEVAQRFPGGVIGVADPAAGLAALASWWRNAMVAKVIGITGSAGKTTVKRMVHHVLSRRLRGSASPKSFNNHLGVPLTILGAGAADDYVVAELGTNAPGEIAALTRVARPDVAVITSVGASHLEKLVSVERVAVEKAAILADLPEDGLAVLWADSPELDRACKGFSGKRIRFGAADDADLRLTGYTCDGLTQRFEVNGRLWVDLPLPGRHNAMNALAAFAVARRFGLDEQEAAAALADFRAPEMRMDVRRVGPVTLINDAYNANPLSMAAALEVLSRLSADRKVLVFGEMRELGPEGPALHRQLGRQAAEVADVLVAVGPLGRHVLDGAAAADGKGLEMRYFCTASEAAQAVPQWLRPGDAVLVKGSRAVGLERVAEAVAAAGTNAGASSVSAFG